MTITILTGCCLSLLATLPDQSVHTCVTSPPYWGLRDYQQAGQLGLELTPAEYVQQMTAVFREVRRVLRDDGTLWLNLGDSYAGSGRGGYVGGKSGLEGSTDGQDQSRIARGSQLQAGFHDSARQAGAVGRAWVPPPQGLKPKDLVGIPWAVAKALQAPYYAGKIRAERDRAWIAAMIDGEGTICGFHHIRADDGRPRTGVHVNITNSNVPLLDEMERIWPASRSEHLRPGAGHLGTRTTYRWLVHGTANKLQFLREVYPYLIAKRRQAVVAYNLLLLVADAKRLGHSPQRDDVRERRAFLVDLLSMLNGGEETDLPPWLIEPPSVIEPGWYLRSDIIWSKPNPMPESVTDRPTKSHEYLFLLTKSERYYYDQEAIAEPVTASTIERVSQPTLDQQGGSCRVPGKTNGAMKAVLKKSGNKARKLGSERGCPEGTGSNVCGSVSWEGTTRNKRTVWTVATKPFSEAHFATYPPELIEPCILAGSPRGGTVLDPFFGAGTTGLVADRLGRHCIGIELNPEYIEIAERRLRKDAGMLADIVVTA